MTSPVRLEPPPPAAASAPESAKMAGRPEGHSADILLLPTVGTVSGSTRVVGDLADAWRNAGLNVRLVFPAPSDPLTQEAVEWLAGDGIAAEASDGLPAWHEPHGLRRAWRFSRWIRGQNSRATYLHYGGNQLAFWDIVGARLARKRTVVMVHHSSPILGKRRKLLTRAAAVFAHKIVVSTPAGKQLLEDCGVRSSRIAVVPLAVRPPAAPAMSRAVARARLGISDSAFVVSSVCRLRSGKNIPRLVEMVAALNDEDAARDAHLVVGGTGEDLERVRTLAADRLSERGHILGYVDDLSVVYAASDVFALPSEVEGFGLVFVEAAWFGVPSVAFDSGGVRYAIAHEQTGLLAPARDWASFQQALARMADSPQLCHDLGRQALERARSEFSLEAMAEGHRRLLGV